MITFTLISPETTVQQGIKEFEIEVLTDAGSIDLATVSVQINEIEVLPSIEAIEGGVAISFSNEVVGPQDLICLVSATDENETRRGAFAITVEAQGRTRVPDYIQSPYMQRLTNYIPERLKARKDKNSVFQQLLNPVALELERIEEKLQDFSRAMDISNPNISDPDWIFECDFQDTEIRRDTTPVVFGMIGTNKIELSNKNSFREFWEEALPDRFTKVSEIALPSEVLLYHVSLDILDNFTNIKNPSKGKLYFSVDEVESMIDISGNVLSRVDLIIDGTSDIGFSQSERVTLLKSGTVSTRKSWSKISSITVLTQNVNASCSVSIHAVPPRLSRKKSEVNKIIERSKIEPIQWAVTVDDEGSCLDLMKSEQGYILDIAKGEDTSESQERFRLTDIEGDGLILNDFAISKHFLYGMSGSTLYIWDTRTPVFSKITQISSTDSPEQDFDIAVYEPPSFVDGAYKASISIEKFPPMGAKTIREYSWSIIAPSGTITYINPTTGDTSSFQLIISNPIPIDYFGIKALDFELDITALGDYIIQLETTLTDGTSEISQRAFSLAEKRAIGQYDLSTIISLDSVPRVICDDDYHIKVLSQGTMTKIKPAYDVFIVDQDANKIFFREDYSQIEISNAN